MRTETRTIQVAEWLGDTPDDFDYEAFYLKYISQNKDTFDRAVKLYKEMDSALKSGAKVFATRSGDFTHEVYSCGLYDGWPFWVPRPCYSYRGPISGEHIEEFYNIRHIRTA